MIDEQHVEELRKEIGEKMARDGEGIPQEYSSDSFKEGYRRGMMGFGSNVVPRKFGKGGNEPKDWKCMCGNVNSGRIRKKIANKIVCWLCELPKEHTEDTEWDGE